MNKIHHSQMKKEAKTHSKKSVADSPNGAK